MRRPVKLLLRTILAVVCAVLLLLLGVLVGSKLIYRDFYWDAARSIAIPGLGDGFIPQGFACAEERFLVSGYMKDSTLPSRIYVLDGAGEGSYAELLTETGAPYTGHCGGITVQGEWLYVSSEEELSVFSLPEVLAGGQAAQLGSIPTGERVSFCTYVDGCLLAGAFYREGNYETPAYHHVTTPAGDENPALIWVYQADADAPFGIDPDPVAALSVRALVQGVTVTDSGDIVLSTSWGVGSSGLWRYRPDDRVGEVNGVPLYYLDSASLVEMVKAPPMSEEILWMDGRVYVLTESACAKYVFGNFIDGRHVFAYQF